jgi:hypothetical protein
MRLLSTHHFHGGECKWSLKPFTVLAIMSGYYDVSIFRFMNFSNFQMLLISAAGLLNSAVVSMVHEHEHGGYLGFQLIYGALGFAIMTPLFAFLFQYFQSSEWEALPW